MNLCILKGRLCKNFELSTTSSGMSVCRIRIAVPRRDKQSGADFVTCVAFKAQAEFLNQYFSKGQEILIQGNLRINQWEGDDGVKREGCEVLINNIDFCGAKQEDKPSGQSKGDQVSQLDTWAELSDLTDKDLPF
jgi:single-strand DNA-binding protein